MKRAFKGVNKLLMIYGTVFCKERLNGCKIKRKTVERLC